MSVILETAIRIVLVLGCVNLGVLMSRQLDSNVLVLTLPGLAVSIYYAIMYEKSEENVKKD